MLVFFRLKSEYSSCLETLLKTSPLQPILIVDISKKISKIVSEIPNILDFQASGLAAWCRLHRGRELSWFLFYELYHE